MSFGLRGVRNIGKYRRPKKSIPLRRRNLVGQIILFEQVLQAPLISAGHAVEHGWEFRRVEFCPKLLEAGAAAFGPPSTELIFIRPYLLSELHSGADPGH